MAEKFYFDFFQIPSTGIGDDEPVRTDINSPIRRSLNMSMSNFGSLNVGLRNSSDYTKTVLSFKAKDESFDWSAVTPDWQFAERNENPHVAGSSVKFIRDDQFIRMGMSKDSGASIDAPRFDVMDTNQATAEGINASTNANLKNWPAEGWRSFGGKYDFLPYSGGTLK